MAKNEDAIKKLKQDLAKIKETLWPAQVVASGNVAPGTEMEDGSVFVGLTPDGRHIFALPMDLGIVASFNDAAKVVKMLNEKKALGHDDWQIPNLDALKVLRDNRDEGALKGTFNTSGSPSRETSPSYYWSSTENGNVPDLVWGLRLNSPDGGWRHKDNKKMSCRPVRIV